MKIDQDNHMVLIPMQEYEKFIKNKRETLSKSNESRMKLLKKWEESWDKKMKSMKEEIIEGFSPYFTKFFKAEDIEDIFRQYGGTPK